MKILKKIVFVGSAMALMLGMSACGAIVVEGGANSSIEAFAVTFPDGSKSDCLKFNANYSAGIRCDWESPSTATQSDPSLLGSIQELAGKKVRCVAYDGNKEGALDCEI